MMSTRAVNSMKKKGGKAAIPKPEIEITPNATGPMAVHGGILKGKGMKKGRT